MSGEQRVELDIGGTVMELIVAMAEGNPGALTVMMKLMRNEPELGLFRILALDGMNIRGTQIWVAYKDHCMRKLGATTDEEAISMLIECLVNPEDRQGLLNTVNEEGLRGNHPHLAEVNASRNGRKLLDAVA